MLGIKIGFTGEIIHEESFEKYLKIKITKTYDFLFYIKISFLLAALGRGRVLPVVEFYMGTELKC